MEQLRIIETFSGIGCQLRGLENSGVFDVVPVATSDIDKDAIVSYAAMHCGLTSKMIAEYKDYPSREDMVKELSDKNIGYDFLKDKKYDWSKVERKKDKSELKKYWLAMHLQNNLGDISKIQRLPECDLLTFSYPCTDCSVSGKQGGMSFEEWMLGLSTRSGLVWEITRLLQIAKDNNELPKYLLLENVSAIISKKFIKDFEYLNKLLNDIGYNVYYKVMNAKNYGVPQNRDRVFGIYIRKDIDAHRFEFPVPFDNGIRLKDMLETRVEDKHYLSDLMLEKITWETKGHDVIEVANLNKGGQKGAVISPDGICSCLTATDYKQPKQILQVLDDTYKNRPLRIYEDFVPTLRAERSGFKVFNGSVIRRLTPVEGFKLMGLTKEDSKKCMTMGVSDTNLYKQAGNGIVVPCVTLLAEHLYKAQYDETFECTDEKAVKE